MKIYVVTSGEYSDYSIEAMFTNKEKAKLYLKYHAYCNENIEEYETADDYLVTASYWNVTVCYKINVDAKGHFSAEPTVIDILLKDVMQPTSIAYTYWMYAELTISSSVIVNPNVSEEMDKQAAEEKVLKIGQDVYTQICDLLSQGASYKDVLEFVKVYNGGNN